MAGENPVVRLLTRAGCRLAAATILTCGLMLALVVSPTIASAQFQVIHEFKGKSDGKSPEAGLFDAGGSLYGTTFGAIGDLPTKHCARGCSLGTEFTVQNNQLVTGYEFQGGNDGAFPTGEVVVDASGNVYGTTELGGGVACSGLGCGTVFKIVGGVETAYPLCNGEDYPACRQGALPHAGPLIGTDGFVYGTAMLGGKANGFECDNNFAGCGVIYRLAPTLKKKTERVLYSFCQMAGCADGAVPYGKLWQDPTSGNLYGTTQFGGANGTGVIFEYQLSTRAYSVLYSFCSQTNCADGAVPEAGVIADAAGNLYGTASAGGGGTCNDSVPGCGVVFELTPGGTYTVLHAFTGVRDAALPQAGVTFDSAGNLYGTTSKGGHGKYCDHPQLGCGTVFMLQPGTTWTETFLHIFGQESSRKDGAQPAGELLLSSNGLLYGTTPTQGDPTCKCGTLFTIPTGKR